MRGIRLRWIAIASIVVTLAGFIFLRGPTPAIKVKPETLFSLDLGPLPVNFTNTMVTSWLVVALMVLLAFLATRRWELVPRGVQNFVEAVLEAFYNLVVNVAGENNGRRFFPVVATIFFFVLFANWFSLFPVFNVIGLSEEEEHGFVMEQTSLGPLPLTFTQFSRLGYSPPFGFNFDDFKGKSIDEADPEAPQKAEQEREKGNFVGEIKPLLRGATTDLNTPLALAIVSAIFVEYWGISSLGLRTYGRKFFNFGGMIGGLVRLRLGQFIQGAIDFFVGFLEFVSEVVRLISFSFRLFGNMFAGEVVILMFTFMTPLVLTVAVYGLELFIGLIQAFIFALLTLVFAIMAVSHGEAAHAAEASGHGAGVGEQGHGSEA